MWWQTQRLPHASPLAENERGVDEREVGEGLREVSELAAGDRITSSERIATFPSSASTIRMMSGVSSRGGMKSIARTVPSCVSKIDSRISVSVR
jgi:hypothetical protein